MIKLQQYISILQKIHKINKVNIRFTKKIEKLNFKIYKQQTTNTLKRKIQNQPQ